MAHIERRAAADLLRTAGPTMSLTEAATVLGIGRSTAYDLARRGEWPTSLLRLGRQYRVPTAQLTTLLESGGAAPRKCELSTAPTRNRVSSTDFIRRPIPVPLAHSVVTRWATVHRQRKGRQAWNAGRCIGGADAAARTVGSSACAARS
jgi:excisionase family DNA binding protein